MGTGGGESDQHVAGLHPFRLDEAALLHDANTKAGQVVVARAVQAGHLRRLPAGEGGAGQFATPRDAAHHLGGDIHVQMAGGVVVEKEQGLGAGDHDIVHAHRHQIDADGVVTPQFQGQLELGADSIGAGDQHWLGEAFQGQLEEGAETAKTSQYPRTEGLFDNGFDALDKLVAGVDIDPGIPVTELLGVPGTAFVIH